LLLCGSLLAVLPALSSVVHCDDPLHFFLAGRFLLVTPEFILIRLVYFFWLSMILTDTIASDLETQPTQRHLARFIWYPLAFLHFTPFAVEWLVGHRSEVRISLFSFDLFSYTIHTACLVAHACPLPPPFLLRLLSGVALGS
jgi:hypothetical protein